MASKESCYPVTMTPGDVILLHRPSGGGGLGLFFFFDQKNVAQESLWKSQIVGHRRRAASMLTLSGPGDHHAV